MSSRLYTRIAIVWVLLCSLPAQAAVDVRTMSIGHGVHAWYAPYDQAPVVDLRLSFEGAGSVSDPSGKAGRANFAAAMLSEGAGNLSAEAFQQELERHAITLEFTADVDRLQVHVHCLREHVGKAGELLALAFSKPTLASADVERVQTQLRSALSQMQESPAYLAGRLRDSTAFAGHPYAAPVLGTVTSIATLTAADVRDYLSTYVTRGNVLIAAAGEVDRSALDSLLTPMVEALTANDAGPVPVTPVRVGRGGETVREASAAPQTVITFAAPALERSDPDYYAAYLLNQIVGGNALTSRLGEQVRKQRGLVYGIETHLEARRGASLFAGALATRNATTDQAIAEVQAVLADIRSKGVTMEECRDAKSYVIGHFPLQMENTRALSSALMMMRQQQLGERYLQERVALFNAVKCSDIDRVAATLLAPDRMLFAIVGGAE